jgi:hypothetical protein
MTENRIILKIQDFLMQKVDNLTYPPLLGSKIVRKIILNDFIVKVCVTYNIKIPNINKKYSTKLPYRHVIR